MSISQSCKKCGSNSLVRDDVTSELFCSSCGIVQGFDCFEAQLGGIDGPQGTFVRVGTSGTGSAFNYKDKKIFEAEKIVDDIVFRLGLSNSKSDDVKTLISTITEGEFGQGDWFPIMVGACTYVAMRKDNRSLSIAEVASVIECDVHELGRMIMRVVDFLDLKAPEFPEFDIVGSFERAMRNLTCFSRAGSDKAGGMVKQGIFLIQCAVKWFLTTGRRPLPVVAAVLFLVAELNEVDVSFDDVAREVHAKVLTSKKRYKELLEALVKVGQALPWGKDLNSKNIVKNVPFVLQYMEQKSMLKPGNKRKVLDNVGFDLGDVVNECIRKEAEYGTELNSLEDDSKYFEIIEGSTDLVESRSDDLEKLKISHECLSLIYDEYLNKMALVKPLSGSEEVHIRKRSRKLGLHACTEWWEGKSELSKKLLLNVILEKDVGLDDMPPSFVSSCMSYERRREKINAAKQRIRRIMCPSKVDMADDGNAHVGKKRKQRRVNCVNWEDLIIETLLLHRVKEEEIEKGHYNTLIDLHVFNDGVFKSSGIESILVGRRNS